MVLTALTAALVAGWIALSRGGVDPAGKPLGTDFIAFWSAGRLTLAGDAAAAYEGGRLQAAQQAAFPRAEVGFSPFPYPPIFLLICAPLAALPYFPALILWLGGTGLAYWKIVRAWLGERGFTLAALAFPAVAVNAAHGQTGFLSAALFGAGALWLQSRPFVAGLALGTLAYKPQLGLLIPVALLAARKWKALAGAAVSVLGLAAVATAVFGVEIWWGFLAQTPLMQAAVEAGGLHPGKLVTSFAAALNLGAPLPLAYGLQAAVALAAATALALFAWRRSQSAALGPVLVAASLLPSPYLLDYDLTLAAIPLAWLFAQGRRDGFLPYEKVALLAAFALPLFARPLQMNLHLPLAPLVLAILFAVALRRGWREG